MSTTDTVTTFVTDKLQETSGRGMYAQQEIVDILLDILNLCTPTQPDEHKGAK